MNAFEFSKGVFTPLFIGSGRLATHLIHYYKLLMDSDTQIYSASNGTEIKSHSIGNLSGRPPRDVRFLTWNRSQNSESELNERIQLASHVYLCISDSAILPFYNKHLASIPNKTVVHFSGSLDFGKIISGAHPLMTFSKNEFYDLPFYKRIHFVLSDGEKIESLLPYLPNSFSEMTAQQKAYYHVLCVLGGNFTMVLFQKMIREMIQMQLPLEGIRTYVEKVVENSFLLEQQQLTGPLIRKDDLTIKKNLQSLEGSPYHNIYFAFVQLLYPEYQGAHQL